MSVKWGLLSTALINEMILRGAAESQEVDVIAVASRDEERARSYAQEYGLERPYGSYEGLRDRLLLLVWALLENFGYRQLTVFWRLRGLVKFLRGRMEWGAMEHRGFHQPSGTRGKS